MGSLEMPMNGHSSVTDGALC